MSFDKEMVRVFNHGICSVAVKTNERTVLIKGTDDPNFPVMESFSLKELEYVNTHSPVIRSGLLEFAEEERDEIYKALHINNWDATCIFESEIDEILTTPTIAAMQRVTEVKDLPTIDRIFAHMKKLIQKNQADVSSRVQKVVMTRRDELRENILNSRIQLVPKKVEPVQTISQEVLDKMVQEKVAAALASMGTPTKEETSEATTPVIADNTEAPQMPEPKQTRTKKTTRTSSKTAPK